MSPRAGQMLVDEIMPILQGVVPSSVRVVGCEDSEELVQDALAIFHSKHRPVRLRAIGLRNRLRLDFRESR